MYKIVIDTKGSDNGAVAIIGGACKALLECPELSVLLVGDRGLILKECEKNSAPMERESSLRPVPRASILPSETLVFCFDCFISRTTSKTTVTASNEIIIMFSTLNYSIIMYIYCNNNTAFLNWQELLKLFR